MVVSFVASQGGTQIGPSTIFASSVKEGMLVYDDATNALKLCNGTTWTALGSGGGSAAGTVTGAVQFRGSGAVLAADDTNFVWDDTNNRLGVGTAAPNAELQLHDGAGTTTDLQITNNSSGSTNSDGLKIRLNNADASLINQENGFIAFSNNGAERLRIVATGNVGIGTTTPNASALLDVTSTTNGFLPPRMTTAQVTAVATPADGLIVYDTDTDTLTLRANGAWVSLSTGGAEADPQVGTLTASKWCLANAGGTAIDCTTDTPTLTETDPKVGTLTNSKWCSTNGTIINCTADAPLATEVDPKVGTLTNTKWCSTDGSVINCTADAPAAGVAGTVAGAVQFRGSSAVFAADDVNYVWDDTNNRLGIGTATPSTALEAVGTIKSSGPFWSAFGNTGTHRGLMLENFDNTANTHGVDIAAKLGGTEFQGLSWVKETGWTSGSAAGAKDAMLQFGVLIDNVPTIPVVVRASGNVGIGTTGPGHKLSIDLGALNNNSSNYGVSVTGDALGNVGYAGSALSLPNSTQNATAYARLARTASTVYLGYELGVDSRDGMRFATASGAAPVERMRIDASGNVGIGTSSPGVKLHVGADNTDGRLFLSGTSSGANPLTTARPTVDDALLMVGRSGGSSGGGIEFMLSPGGSGFGWKINTPDADSRQDSTNSQSS